MTSCSPVLGAPAEESPDPFMLWFATSLRHVQQCKAIQYGDCPDPHCEPFVQCIQHFAACKEKRTQCDWCERIIRVIFRHSLQCGVGQALAGACFVPDCGDLRGVLWRRWGDHHLDKRILQSLTKAEVRSIVWCLGGGRPDQLRFSTGASRVQWKA